MALWLEHRDDKGTLIDRAQFSGGQVIMHELTDFAYQDGPLVLSMNEARQLARVSSHLPVEKRDWVLRIADET